MISDQRDDNRPQFSNSGRPVKGRNPCESCYPVSVDDVLDSANMADAWNRVQRNKGAPSPDARTIEDTKSYLKTSWPEVKEVLQSGAYQPGSVRMVYIPKGNGKHRMLGIPNVIDRLIQQAIHQVLSPHYDKGFSDSSSGFRPGRNAWQAIEQAHDYAKQG